MILSILNRVKKLLDIQDNSQDEFLILLIESAIFQVQSYIHTSDVGGCEPLIAMLVAHNYTSGEGEGEGSSSSGGGVEPKLGEVKSESYYGVKYEYTTTADFASKSSSSSSSSKSGEPSTYFFEYIAPFLKERRHIQTLKKPLGWVADEDICR